MARQFAFQLSLLAFAATALNGLLYRNDFVSTVWQALMLLVAFYGLGWLAGELARLTVEQNARQAFDKWKSEVDQPDAK